MRNLLSFIPHMWRDYVMTRGGAMAVVAAVFAGPVLISFASSDLSAAQERAQAVQMTLIITPFLTLVATYGLIGQDFRLGFFRPLFAKPIPVPVYYFALFACALVSFWLVQALVLLVFAGFGINAWDSGAWLEMTLRFWLLGSLVFLISRVSRLDWIIAVLFFSLASPLRQAYPAEESIRGWLINVFFAPTHRLQFEQGPPPPELFSPLITSAGVEWGSVAWAVGYGVVCLTISLWIVRRTPLASVQ